MKKLLIFICLLTCTDVFAISCPNNGNILNIGYDLSQVMQICGQPLSKNSHQQTMNLTEELTYYKNSFGSNIKITLLFNQGQLVNIHTFDSRSALNQTCQSKNQFGQTTIIPCPPQEKNLTTSGLCGQFMQVGNTLDYIRSICGNPAALIVTSSKTVEITELKYSDSSPKCSLVFENNKLIDWK